MSFAGGFLVGLYVGISVTAIVVGAAFFYFHRDKK